MLTKNKIIYIFFLSFLFININLQADEFDISAIEIIVDKKNNIVVGKGSVTVTDSDGKIINADKITYEKSKEFLTARGSVNILDKDGNILKSNKATYDKKNEIITTYNNSELILKEGYNLTTNNIKYFTTEKIMSSDENSIFSDMDGNVVKVSMFRYQLEKNLFSSIGNIKIIDVNSNKYFFKELHVDTKKREMVGSEVSVVLDQDNFGVSKESDPRFVANDIFISKNKTNMSKGVFTVCKKNKDKCPPWLLQSKKISHDKTKKTIYYENAILKVYDIPIFYFPRFFHPDPTVKRQSGLLNPFFTNTTSVGLGLGFPYYWAIGENKDLTFTPKIYSNENMLFLNEYRQAFRNGFLTLDTSYTKGYKKETAKQKTGSRNHIFANLDFNLAKDKPYQSDLSFQIQKTSNDTYFKVHDINTELVDAENTNLENKVVYSFSNNDSSFDISAQVYENLNEKTNNRYEYVLPNIFYKKSFLTERFGNLNFESNAYYNNFDADKHTTIFTNDIIWNPKSYFTKSGFVNTVQGMFRNTNYEAKNTDYYKNNRTINEFSGVLGFKSSLPLKKDGINFLNTFSPNLMIRFAPGHMRDHSNKDITLNYSNLYSLNKTSEIEDGLSAVLGFDFKMNKKDKNNDSKEKLSISMGQVFRPEWNEDIPSKSSLDQKMSDVVGEVNYNFSEIGNISYKFSLDHNFNNLNYNDVSTTLNFGKIGFNLDYLEEANHVGEEHYIKSGISLNLNENNKFKFETKKNFKTESTELYDISYQYGIDCLTAGVVFRREFYEDSDVEQKDSLLFTITFVPFAEGRAPLIP